MRQRIITASALVVGALLLLYFGGVVFAIAGTVCFLLALYEMHQALAKAGHRPVTWPTYLAMVLSIPIAQIFGPKTVVPILMGSCLITIICIIFRDEPTLEDILMSLIPLFSVVLPGLCIISLAQVEPLSVQRTLIGVLLVVPVLGDTCAFFVGSRMKGPKLCPAVSPNKTISGAIGGLIGSVCGCMLVCLISYLICAPTTHPFLPTWWQYLLLGLVGGVASQMGDLFASMVKRHCGIKDYSNLFPGHGGMMDRLDSILFMSVVVYCFRLITVP